MSSNQIMNLNFTCTEEQSRFYELPHKYRAFVGGYGTGKTEALVTAAMISSLQSKKALIGIFAPTYDLLVTINIPRVMAALDSMGKKYRYNAQQKRIFLHGQKGGFIFRSLDAPHRIVGFEILDAFIDELDTLPQDHAEEAFQKIDARCRQNINGLPNRISVFTTPEGFKFVYKKWVAETDDDYGMIQASSMSNPFLPKGYVERLMKNYPPNLREAYINGQFVNLTSGTVYNMFDSKLNDCDTIVDKNETLYVGMDFNVGKTTCVIMVKREKEYHAVDEITDAYDTTDICKRLRQRYPNNRINVYPDASCNQRRTSSNTTDNLIIQQHGFTVYVDTQNPRVRDRINTVNGAFCNMDNNRRVKVNTKMCKVLTKCLMQQSYNKNGEPDKTTDTDHSNDALGYAICQLLPFNNVAKIKLLKF